ncbi:hypothetical protein NC653_018995 [Populus alba x Populus x berolinensis]|uniref:Uncharacterized protein n=1 Tax=Populus alba x Populus x berolinensis TaxID=444605 RepID=A0AAD6QHQ9_9ROSI|nr:hypothetical protein NC653_018995 [Populus alba x Populus x berolinensis]
MLPSFSTLRRKSSTFLFASTGEWRRAWRPLHFAHGSNNELRYSDQSYLLSNFASDITCLQDTISSPYPVTSAAGISQASANSTCLEMSLSPSMEHPNKNVLAGTF